MIPFELKYVEIVYYNVYRDSVLNVELTPTCMMRHSYISNVHYPTLLALYPHWALNLIDR